MSTVTIRKVLTCFSGIWTWAIRIGVVTGSFPNRGLRYPKTAEKSPFQTWIEIERQIQFCGLGENEQSELWEGLYLTADEIEKVLNYVHKTATHAVMHPMFVLAAHPKNAQPSRQIPRSKPFASKIMDLSPLLLHRRFTKAGDAGRRPRLNSQSEW